MLTILGKELVMGRDRAELGLASVPSSSWPLPVLTVRARRSGKEEGPGIECPFSTECGGGVCPAWAVPPLPPTGVCCLSLPLPAGVSWGRSLVSSPTRPCPPLGRGPQSGPGPHSRTLGSCSGKVPPTSAGAGAEGGASLPSRALWGPVLLQRAGWQSHLGPHPVLGVGGQTDSCTHALPPTGFSRR